MAPESLNVTMDAELVDEAKKIIRSIDIPSPPRILLELGQAMSSAEPEYRIISDLVSQDVALTAKIIKVANSPFFGLRQRVQSINTALSVLGLENFNNIVLTSAFRDAMKSSAMPLMELEAFHSHSILMARVCQAMAQLRQAPDVQAIASGQAYILGLFHDCGIPMLAQKFPAYLKEIRKSLQKGEPLVDVEESTYKTNHCVVGSFLARAWKLPITVNAAIAFHHHPDATFDNPELETMVRLILCSETAVSWFNQDSEEVEDLYTHRWKDNEAYMAALSTLGLESEQLLSLEEKMDQWTTER